MPAANWINNSFAVITALVLLWVWMAARRDDRPAAWRSGPVLSEDSFEDAYRLTPHVHHNRSEVEQSAMCACLSCEQMFSPEEIEAWHRSESGDTAVCPRCGMAAVVGSSAGILLTPRLVHKARVVRDVSGERRVRVG